jgi:hypothetical protein
MKKFPKYLVFIVLAGIAGIYVGLVALGNFINQINAQAASS